MYFYKAFFKDGTIDYYALARPIRSPKLLDLECIKLQHIGFFHFAFGYVSSLFVKGE